MKTGTLKCARLRAPTLQKPPKFNKRTPKREKKENCGGGGKTKSAKFWAPTLRSPTFSVFGPPPFGAPTLRGRTDCETTKTLIWAKNGLAKKTDWPKKRRCPKMDWPGWPRTDWPKTVSAGVVWCGVVLFVLCCLCCVVVCCCVLFCLCGFVLLCVVLFVWFVFSSFLGPLPPSTGPLPPHRPSTTFPLDRPSPGPPKISLFFFSPAGNFILSSLSGGSSR